MQHIHLHFAPQNPTACTAAKTRHPSAHGQNALPALPHSLRSCASLVYASRASGEAATICPSRWSCAHLLALPLKSLVALEGMLQERNVSSACMPGNWLTQCHGSCMQPALFDRARRAGSCALGRCLLVRAGSVLCVWGSLGDFGSACDTLLYVPWLASCMRKFTSMIRVASGVESHKLTSSPSPPPPPAVPAHSTCVTNEQSACMHARMCAQAGEHEPMHREPYMGIAMVRKGCAHSCILLTLLDQVSCSAGGASPLRFQCPSSGSKIGLRSAQNSSASPSA